MSQMYLQVLCTPHLKFSVQPKEDFLNPAVIRAFLDPILEGGPRRFEHLMVSTSQIDDYMLVVFHRLR